MIQSVFQCSLCERTFPDKEEAEVHEGFCELRAEFKRMGQFSSADFEGLLCEFMHNIGGSNFAVNAHELATRAQKIKSIMHRVIDMINDVPVKFRKEPTKGE